MILNHTHVSPHDVGHYKRMQGRTHVIAFNVGKRELLRQILRDCTLSTASRTSNDPYVAMVRRIESAVDLLGSTWRGEIHRRRCGKVVVGVDGVHLLVE